MFNIEMSPDAIWIGIGLLGQSLFFMRFLFQWIASEKAGQSVIPHVFWYFSIGGSLILLAYAVWRQDPVFMIGQSTGLFIYMRNIVLIRRSSSSIVQDPESA